MIHQNLTKTDGKDWIGMWIESTAPRTMEYPIPKERAAFWCEGLLGRASARASERAKAEGGANGRSILLAAKSSPPIPLLAILGEQPARRGALKPAFSGNPSPPAQMAATLHGPVINAACIAQAGAQELSVASSSTCFALKAGILKSRFVGSRPCSKLSRHPPLASSPRKPVRCSLSDGDDAAAAENFAVSDENYVNSSVLEAVEVKSGSEGFIIKMRDGRLIRCQHNHAEGGHLPDYAPQPAIVLKMDDGSNLLLPIIVLELPCIMLMEAVRNTQPARPTVYHVMRDMIEVMGYKPMLVRVTKRVQEAYYARLYLCKEENGKTKMCSLDVRPSDGINLAVRCKIPIQVNKQLAYGDGVRVVQEAVKLPLRSLKGLALDRPEAGPCAEAEEFLLVRSMMVAAYEERYKDAARIRDQLSKLRAANKRQQEA